MGESTWMLGPFDEAVAFIKISEGFCAHSYLCKSGKVTVGYGTRQPLTDLELDAARNAGECTVVPVDNLEGGRFVTLDRAAADALLRMRLRGYYRDLDSRAIVSLATLPPCVRVAMLDMAYNMGVNGLLKFRRMWSAIARGDFELAAREAWNSRWRRQVKSRAPRVVELIRSAA